MPDINGVYNGDRANILPDNTGAFLHLTDQFQRIEQERRMQQRYEQKQEQERNARMQAYIGNAFDPDKFKGADLAQRGINEKLSATMGKMLQIKKNNPNLSDNDLAQLINQEAGGIKSFADKTKEIQGSVGKAVTDITQSDPSLDAGAFADLALHDALFNTDAKGNKTLKEDAEVNPLTADEYLANTLKAHPDKLLRPGYATIQNVLKDNKLRKFSVQDDYNPATGDRTRAGGKGEYPYYSQPVIDSKGSYLGNKITTVPYKVDGQEVRDQYGKPVEVIPDEFYNALTRKPSSITVQLDSEFKNKYPNVDPKSAMADMLKKQIMTDLVSTHQDGSFEPFKDQSPDLKYKLHKERMDEERLRLAEAANNRAEKKLDIMVDNKTGDGVMSRDIYQEIADKTGSTMPGHGRALVDLSVTAQKVILDYVNSIAAGKDEKLTQSDIYIKTLPDNKVGVVKRKTEDNKVVDTPVAELKYEDVNNKVNPSVKERQSMLQKAKDLGNKVISKIKGKKEQVYKGIDDKGNPIFE